MHFCSTTLLGLAGDIFLRTVLPFDRYPWKVLHLVHDSVDAASKRQVAVELNFIGSQSRSCCCDRGFTMKLVRRFPTVDELQGVAYTDFIRDFFECCPDNNIGIEFRFGRARHQVDSCGGKSPTPATLASNHVLAEVAAQYDTVWHAFKEQAFAKAEVERASARVAARGNGSFRTEWNQFGAKKDGQPMREEAAKWTAMTGEAKRAET